MIVARNHKENTNEHGKAANRFSTIKRDFYGDDKTQKPNDHCVWLEVDFFDITLAGWYEEKIHYQERVLKTLYPHLFR